LLSSARRWHCSDARKSSTFTLATVIADIVASLSREVVAVGVSAAAVEPIELLRLASIILPIPKKSHPLCAARALHARVVGSFVCWVDRHCGSVMVH
jgi:hypothetical protein